MEAFFKKYYVAPNMCLILSGDLPSYSLTPLLEQTFGRIATDNGELVWEGEGDLAEGAAVFVEGEEGLTPAPDGEYKTEDGKTIVVVEGRVAEIRDPEAEVAPEPAVDEEKAALRAENAELRAQVETLTARVAELSRMPAAKPAHEEVKETETKLRRTGNKGLDRIAALMEK
jgi:secreted Zn-dependent insulinase-like peptidase